MTGTLSTQGRSPLVTALVIGPINALTLLTDASPNLAAVKTVFFAILFVRYLRLVLNALRYVYLRLALVGPSGFFKEIYQASATFLIAQARKIPAANAMITKELDKTRKDLEKITHREKGETKYLALPSAGLTLEDVKKEISRFNSYGHNWDDGKISGCIYHGGKDLTELITYAYSVFCVSNPLHPDVFPGLRRMDAEVVAMTVAMFGGSVERGQCGTTTSGGTESILMACKAYRDWALKEKGITEPEIIAPITVHAAFDKAAAYFKIKLIHIPVDTITRRVRIDLVKKALSSNTIAVVGSAPSFPHGVIDDIEALSAIALKHKIGLHVDSCLGGFLLPFMRKAGFNPPKFDFSVPGVTSISADPHKFGYTPKGVSVIMYSNENLRRYQYFVAPDWPGGIYASPTIAGSRPGAIIAGAWATMVHIGEQGYVEYTRQIVNATRHIEEGIRKIPGLYVVGKPDTSVVGFATNIESDIYRIGEELTKKGWNLNTLQNPASMHICVTYLTVKAVDDFLEALTAAAQIVNVNPGTPAKGSGAMYGMAAAIPDRSLVGDIAGAFVDCLYKAN